MRFYGEELRNLREEIGISQGLLARESKVSRYTIQTAEDGMRMLSGDEIRSVSNGLNNLITQKIFSLKKIKSQISDGEK